MCEILVCITILVHKANTAVNMAVLVKTMIKKYVN